MDIQIPDFALQIKFIKYIQWLLESGSYTSTYKFALLMSLTNVAIESGIYGNETLFVRYNQLAEQYVKLYWKQVLPYTNTKNNLVETACTLSQNTGKQAAIINQIITLQKKQANINIARLMFQDDWQRLIKNVARTIHRYPADLLQSPENIERTFLYHYDKKNAKGILLNTGIAYCLAHFSNIIFKLCQQYWTEFVRKNKQNRPLFDQETDLQRFLFGESRQSLSSLVPLLTDIQKNECFYCYKKLTDKGGREVDHFIPWSKYPNDTAHNFVLADKKCNNAKRDYLADSQFYKLWLDRNEYYGDDIKRFSIEQGFIANLDTSERISQWAYNLAIENKDLVWLPPKKINTINANHFINLRINLR